MKIFRICGAWAAAVAEVVGRSHEHRFISRHRGQ